MKELKLEDILANTSDLKEKQTGYVSIVGRPNTWKSTFVNALIGEKISITTNVPQTTRRKVLAIYNDDDSQIIFFDTPWIHKSNKLFNEQINSQAISSLNDAELILYFIDSSREWWEEEKYIKEIVSQVKVPVLRVYTKSDLSPKITIPESDDTFKISSPSKDGFELLLSKIKTYLPLGPTFFPEDIYTKQDIYFRISEIIREKVFENTKEEIPHSTFIWVDEIEDKEEILKIVAYIYAESDSQKYVLIWKAWNLITRMWTQARKDLEKVFWKKVFLALRVKVKKNWRKDERLIKNILQ